MRGSARKSRRGSWRVFETASSWRRRFLNSLGLFDGSDWRRARGEIGRLLAAAIRPERRSWSRRQAQSELYQREAYPDTSREIPPGELWRRALPARPARSTHLQTGEAKRILTKEARGRSDGRLRARHYRRRYHRAGRSVHRPAATTTTAAAEVAARPIAIVEAAAIVRSRRACWRRTHGRRAPQGATAAFPGSMAGVSYRRARSVRAGLSASRFERRRSRAGRRENAAAT